MSKFCPNPLNFLLNSGGDHNLFKDTKSVRLSFGEMCLKWTKHKEYFNLLERCSHKKHKTYKILSNSVEYNPFYNLKATSGETELNLEGLKLSAKASSVLNGVVGRSDQSQCGSKQVWWWKTVLHSELCPDPGSTSCNTAGWCEWKVCLSADLSSPAEPQDQQWWRHLVVKKKVKGQNS